MSEALNAAIAELETKAMEFDGLAAKHRAGAEALRLLMDPTRPSIPTEGVITIGRAAREVNELHGRTFKCCVCKRTKAAHPTGKMPKTCKDCKEAAKKHA